MVDSRPHVDTSVTSGLAHEQPPGASSEFEVFIPDAYAGDRPTAIVLLLHPSGGNGATMASDFASDANTNGVILVAPSSQSYTWDRMVSGDYGPDVEEIDGALAWAFEHLNVDRAHVAIAGFSDGATYSVLLGLKNGDLFTHVMAFAECARIPDDLVGNPLIFIGHGTDDHVLPIADCSRELVPDLRERGYTVDYLEYPTPDADGHYVPEDISLQAFAWFTSH